MASVRFPGPRCQYRLLVEIDNGTLCRDASPCPGSTGRPSLWPEFYAPGFFPAALGMSNAITDADKAEFDIIKKMPVFDSRRRSYRNVNHYVSDRTLYFGPPSAYTTFAAESDAELANTKWMTKSGTQNLKSMIEFNGKSEAQKQQIFYRWVRKAYKVKYGDDTDVPALIRRGMSQKLYYKIIEVRGSVRVKNVHHEKFHAGGFNPRPIKFSNHYLLGTLSEHGTGMAVDIDDAQNAQLTTKEWEFIENLVGKHVVRSGRWDTETAAEGLWKDIVEVNSLFVKKVADEIKRIEKERIEKEKTDKEKAVVKPAPPHLTKVHKGITPLQEILGKHFERLSPWATTGFFHLPLELVLELQAHGFTWGATFTTNVDLHHFELHK